MIVCHCQSITDHDIHAEKYMQINASPMDKTG